MPQNANKRHFHNPNKIHATLKDKQKDKKMENTNRNTTEFTCPKCYSHYVRQTRFEPEYFFYNTDSKPVMLSIPFECMDCGNDFFNVYKLEYLKSED